MSSKPILLIGGIDPSGHAGLLRDINISSSVGCKSQILVTALTAQNAKKYSGTYPVPLKVIEAQLKSLGPLNQFGAIKTGMLVDDKIINLLGRILKQQKQLPPIVIDPVIWSTTGGELLTPKGCAALFKKLLPMATLWTPNIDEAVYFSGFKIKNRNDVEKAANELCHNVGARRAVPVLIKGGHLKGDAHDYFFDGKKGQWLEHTRLPLKNPRGMGCRLATLIACELSMKKNAASAIKAARIKLENILKKNVAALPRNT